VRMKNLELKIKIGNFGGLLLLLKKIKAKYKCRIVQKDTYFNCKNGHLKLREINNKEFELIEYNRPNNLNSKISDYKIEKLSKQVVLKKKKDLLNSIGISVVVNKKRDLWMTGHTRIHLDSVRKLGKFLELETVIDGISEQSAYKEQNKVITELGLNKYKKCGQSYSDMLLAK